MIKISREIINLISRVQELEYIYKIRIKLEGNLNEFQVEVSTTDKKTIFEIKIELVQFGAIAEESINYIDNSTTIKFKRADKY